MPTNFPHPVHFITTLATAHVSGDGQLVLQTGDGAKIGSLASNEVYAVTAVSNPGPSETVLANFLATGLSTNTLTGVVADSNSTDTGVLSGTPIQVRVTPSWMSLIHTTINTIDSSVVHLSGNETIAGIKTFSSTITGNITGNAAGITGTNTVGHGGTGLSTIAAGKLLYASALDTLAPLTLGTSLAAPGGVIDVQANTVTQKVIVSKAGTTVGTRHQFNLIEGSNVTLTVADNAGSDSVDVTAAIVASPVFTGTVRIDSHYGTIASSNSGTFDLSVSDWQQRTLDGTNGVLTITGDHDGQQFSIAIQQDATGSRTVTWWTGILWPGGSVPTLTTTANKRDVFTFKRLATNVYLGFFAGANL